MENLDVQVIMLLFTFLYADNLFFKCMDGEKE